MKDKREAVMPQSVKAVLEVCREIELACARLYETYALAHKANGPLSALWSKTAQEEQGHAEQLALVIRAMQDKVTAAWVDRSTAEAKLAKVRTRALEASVHPPAPAEALRIALELERELDAFHANNAASFKDPSTRKLLQAMLAADKSHTDQLARALENLAEMG